MSTNAVEKYYQDKKRRYLEDMKRAAENMTTGTPHDWEDAQAYIDDAGLEEPAKDGADDNGTGDVDTDKAETGGN